MSHLLQRAITVDLLYSDGSPVRAFRVSSGATVVDDYDPDDAVMGSFHIIPRPAVEYALAARIHCIDCYVFKRSLPLSSTQAGSPFRLFFTMFDIESYMTCVAVVGIHALARRGRRRPMGSAAVPAGAGWPPP